MIINQQGSWAVITSSEENARLVLFMDLKYWNDCANSGKLVFGGRGKWSSFGIICMSIGKNYFALLSVCYNL